MRMWTVMVAGLVACGGQGAPADAPSAASDAEIAPKIEGRQIDVAISSAGYDPDEVRGEPGETLTLVFHRADERNCGGEVVFPALDARIDIPVGKPVPFTLKVPESGSLTFTCGMQMYKGAVVVDG